MCRHFKRDVRGRGRHDCRAHVETKRTARPPSSCHVYSDHRIAFFVELVCLSIRKRDDDLRRFVVFAHRNFGGDIRRFVAEENTNGCAAKNFRRGDDRVGDSSVAKMIAALIAGFLSGMAASMGLGGGFVLLMYLTAVAGVEQLRAQGMNLLFFLPIAVVAICFHLKKKLIDKRPLLPCIGFGVIGVAIGAGVAFWFPTNILSKVFAGFILLLGIRELFHKKAPHETDLTANKSSKKARK